MCVVQLQHQCHILTGSKEVHSLGGDNFNYGGSDDGYNGEVR